MTLERGVIFIFQIRLSGTKKGSRCTELIL